jgi:hypothetical protein
MFRKNELHRQQKMFTTVDQLPEKAKKRLENSWAHIFYHEFFCRIDESVFSVLYSETYSRPNTPVNMLIGFETLKSGFGHSDEELYDHFLFDIQFRYALGLHDIDKDNFDLRTIYNFRSAISSYEEKMGINLVRKAVEQLTDEQIKRFEIKTGLQRMDSTMIQSNIRKMSRLHLLVEIIHRVYRILTEEEKAEHQELFCKYIKEDSLHYCYRVKRDDIPDRMGQIGLDLRRIVIQFGEKYSQEQAIRAAIRVFREHFRVTEDEIVAKENKDLDGATLQSPVDEDATFRRKSGENSRGYVANITETCDDENELQLITRISVDSNVTDDQQLLSKDVENLKTRGKLDELYTDAGYCGPVAAEAAEKHQIKQSVSAIKGRKKEKGRIGLEDFHVECDSQGVPNLISCPQVQTVELRKGKKQNRYSAGFAASKCENCPLKASCPAKRLKKRDVFVMRFSSNDLRVAEQRTQVSKTGKEIINKRASVESTVRSVIHSFGGHLCKMPVRKKSRINTMLQLSYAMVNIRRIMDYLFNIRLNENKIIDLLAC